MFFAKKLPWASLLLLLFTYSIFGWLISAVEISWLLWLMGAAYSLLIALTLTAPIMMIRRFFGNWLQSDTRAFTSVVVGAFLVVVILCHLQVFIRILVLIASGALVRLDLQTAGYSEWQAFCIIAVVSLIGFSIGVAAYQLALGQNFTFLTLAN